MKATAKTALFKEKALGPKIFQNALAFPKLTIARHRKYLIVKEAHMIVDLKRTEGLDEAEKKDLFSLEPPT